jgi:hypothetical protein
VINKERKGRDITAVEDESPVRTAIDNKHEISQNTEEISPINKTPSKILWSSIVKGEN